ncbi:MAG: hypothetical protein V1887_03435 [Candidatus Aenigmatarchaeota archaeon]
MGPEIIVGVLGAIFILGAWVFETYEGVKKHKALIDLRFAAVYALGNGSLILYSWFVHDPVFLVINASILAVVAFEIAYTLTKLKKRVK